jgi:hypothetical protein
MQLKGAVCTRPTFTTVPYVNLPQGLVDRLQCLDAFLVDFLNRKQQRGTSSRYSPVRAGLQGIGGGYNPAASGLGGGLFGSAHAQVGWDQEQI